MQRKNLVYLLMVLALLAALLPISAAAQGDGPAAQDTVANPALPTARDLKLAQEGPAAPPAAFNPAAVLYDNGPLTTHPGGGAGGANASAVQTALLNSTYGFGHAISSGFRVADDFTVPAGGWNISTITFYAYQTGSTTTSTINNVNLRIWNGPPGQGGSSVVFGDTTTNRLAGSSFSNIYRVLDTGLLDSARPIMADVVTVNTNLPAGTYWLDWQTGGTLASGPWAPPVTILGQTAKPGANGLQFDPTASTWNALVDTGAAAQQDLPFVIEGAGATGPSISLAKTVGTTAGVCANTSAITVPEGTTVYYCYTVTNTGDTTLDIHGLTDNVLGTIFSGLNYSLAPGASVNTVQAGLSIPYVANATVTNVGTWTASNQAGAQATANATATVTVIPNRCPVGSTEVTLLSQDFSGSFPPAGWVVANSTTGCVSPGVPDWTNTDPGLRTNLTGGSGAFAIADSDACGSTSIMNAQMWTPALDLTGLTDPRISYYTDYNDIATGGDMADLDFSTDGGSSWTNLINWDADHRGPLEVVQSFAADGEANTVVRWNYTNATWDWWWQVDSVEVTACEAAGGVCPTGPETGELTPNDPVFNRPVGFGGSCSLSGVGTAVHYDVYSYNLAGAPPHDLFASLVGGATFDTVLVFYQAPDGSQNPFDPTQGCLNSVAYNDDFGGGLQSQISATGLAEGWVDVVVTTFDNGTTGAYTMDVASQSCQSGGGEPNIDVDPLSMSASQPTNTTTQQTLDVGNTGTADLTWTIAEEPGVVSPPAAAPGSAEKLGAPNPAPLTGEQLDKLIEANLADVVQDGSFEAGTPSPFWNESSTNFGTPLCDVAGCGTGTGTGPLTGDWWAWFGGIAAYEAGNVSQSVTIPAGGPATLSFWVEQFVCSGDANDYLDVLIDGTTLWSTNAAAAECGVLGYRQVTLDVSAYADGGAHLLEFNSETFGSANTNFFVDDVVLDAEGGGAVCTSPSDVPWLSVSPNNGTTAPTAVTPVDVTFDSTGLAAGTYNANLCIDSNDPDAGPGNETELVIVPVELTVTEPQNAAIVITKTVGLVAGVCATTSTLDVAAGTTVYYCYTVTNTGDVTLNDHDLVDDQLGTIFSGLNYALTPGSSVNTVAAGLSIPAVINTTTTNVATWTAAQSSTGGLTATATATATVNVASIEIVKTVGTDPGVCAATSNITVLAGTTVYYCYTVTNTGDVTLNLHDLSDDMLGTLFTGLAYALTPGSSVNTVAAGLTIPYVANAPTTNTATWTAYNTGGVSVTAEASAFVDVIYFSCENPEEDFESAPLGWTMVNNAGGASWGPIATCGESGSGGNFTGGLGDAACMSPSSLDEGAYDAEMRTPVFSLVGYSNSTISYLANYQNWAGIDRLNFDISADGGATWTTLRSWNSDYGAFQNTPGVYMTVDLADYLGQSNLMLRWHYFWDNPQALGWYAQIDEAEFKCIEVPPTAVTLDGLSAAQAPLPVAGLPLAALPALVSLALGAAYVLRRKE